MKAWIKGISKKATISASQSALTDSIWFIKYPFSLYAKFKPQKPSIGFLQVQRYTIIFNK